MMNFSLFELAQVILADIFLSGDNAIIIGMAAAGLSEKFRKRVIFSRHNTKIYKQSFLLVGGQRGASNSGEKK